MDLMTVRERMESKMTPRFLMLAANEKILKEEQIWGFEVRSLALDLLSWRSL